MTSDKKAEAQAFLKAHNVGMLATVGADGKPRASIVHYVSDEHFNIYFLTLFASRKFAAMRANPAVAFTIGAREIPQTIQMEGAASELTHADEKKEHITELMKVLTSNSTYYAPLMKLDPSEIVMMWIKPTWVRWGDYASLESGSDNIFTEIPIS